MHHENSLVNTKKKISFNVDDKECGLAPGDQAVDSNDDQLSARQGQPRHRSFSLFDMLDERQVTDLELDDSQEFFPDEKYLTVSATTLPKFCRTSRRLRRLNTLLLEAVKSHDVQEIERLLKAGANPNATCCMHYVSVVHRAALRSDDALSLLLSYGADKQRMDRLGRTPLHLAAWAGNVKQIAIMLGASIDLQNKLAAGDMSASTEEEVKSLMPHVKELVNVKCDFGHANTTLPKEWKDNTIDHNCNEFETNLRFFQPGWSALHAASARAHCHCARLLIAAGANPCARDLLGRTPLDIAGSAYYEHQDINPQSFSELVSILTNEHCKNFTIRNRKTLDTPIHTAVEIGSLDAVSVLVGGKVPVHWLNRTGLTPLHICVKKKLKEHLQILLNHGINDSNIPIVDVKDKDGRTILHESILEEWAPGVRVAIEAGANITAKDNHGETAIHLAAAKGNVYILNEILSVAKEKDVIDRLNSVRETALFKAVSNGHTDCVQRLLKEGASIKKTLPRQVNLFHVAAEKGVLDVLQVLLDHDYTITRRMINYLTADDKKGYGPIHFAVYNNHLKCVKLLLSKNAYRSLRTSYGLQKGSTPLHIAAMKDNVEIAKIIMKNSEETVHTVNDAGWTPLHTASHYGSRDIITLLLNEGADLSCSANGPNKCRTTAIDMIMNNLSKPTEFMETIFDSYIYTNDSNLHDPNCEVTLNYKILVPKSVEKEQMKVIEAFINTRDLYGQRRLLVHPLIESFLYLKWKALLPFFYTKIAFYAFFVMSLTTFIISVYFYKDTKYEVPTIFNATGWAIVLYLTICFIVAQEILYMNVRSGYFLLLETWVKISAVSLSVILPYAVLETSLSNADWPRHVATGALLLSWLEMMFLLSRFPDWGYYVLMFEKVFANVAKILLTFAFLVIGFSLSFMIQFHSQVPFEHPWAALVKTMVMMTSEFNYDDLVKQDSKEFATSLFVVRLIFFLFLVLAAIVLMNLMVGVAVNDLHKIQVYGNVRRLRKQVEFLGSLENLVYNRLFKKILPKWLENMLSNRTKILSVFNLCPSVPKSECYKALPSHIREAVFEKAQSQKKQKEDELGSQNYKKKIDEIYDATVTRSLQENITKAGARRIHGNTNYKYVAKQIVELDTALSDVKNKTKLSIKEIKSSIHELNNKMDIILKKLGNR